MEDRRASPYTRAQRCLIVIVNRVVRSVREKLKVAAIEAATVDVTGAVLG